MVLEKESRILSNTLNWFENTWRTIDDFRYIASIGIKEGSDSVYWRNRNTLQDLLKNKEFEDIFLDKKYFIKNQHEIAERLAVKTVTNAEASIRAATVIFSHTILDTLITDLCKLTKLKFTERWDKELKECEISFKFREYGKKDLEVIRNSLINQQLKRLERSSITDRMEFLFRCCNLGSEIIMKNYHFDTNRIKKFDKLRHIIVHGKDTISEVDYKLEDELEYLKKTGLFFIFMFAKCYEIMIDPKIWLVGDKST